MKPAPAACAVAVVLLAACMPPQRDYDAKQILEVKDLQELMYVQATVADRRFRIARRADPEKLTRAQFDEFVDMGVRLGAAAQVLPGFSEEPEFDAFAKQMGERARDLERAAKARDGRATVELAGRIRKVCAACHDKFR